MIRKDLLNKLLKSLEEPPIKTTIFFINNTKKEFIPTIKSRAITLRFHKQNDESEIHLEIKKEAKKIVDEYSAGRLNLSELYETFAKDKFKRKILIKEIINKHIDTCSDYKKIDELLHQLKWYTETDVYNLYPQERNR